MKGGAADCWRSDLCTTMDSSEETGGSSAEENYFVNYTFTDRSHSGRVAQGIMKLCLEDELFADVTISVEGKEFQLHRLVLSAQSCFFRSMFTSNLKEAHNRVIELQSKVLKLVDISYGGENGFNQAIELSTEVLSNVKFIQEKKLIGRYFDEISQDTGKYCFGVEDTLKALEMGAVEILIVYENLDIMRYVLHCQGTEEEKILYLTPEQEKDKSHFTDKETGQEHELIESMPLLEWFANNYKKFGATLEIVTDKSQEGSQFVKGFGGIGGILRYRVDFQGMEYQGGDDEFFDLDDY